MPNKERVITPSQITHVISGSRNFGSQESAKKGIEAHKQSVLNVASRVQPIFENFAPSPNQIPAKETQYIQSEQYHQMIIEGKEVLILRTRSDLEIKNPQDNITFVVEIKPTPKISHGIQTIMTCMIIANETDEYVEGGIFHYLSDSISILPSGGDSIWETIKELSISAYEVASIQNQLDENKIKKKAQPKNPNKTTLTWQPTLPGPGMEREELLSEKQIKHLSDEAISIRREKLDPLFTEISPLISSWIKEGINLS